LGQRLNGEQNKSEKTKLEHDRSSGTVPYWILYMVRGWGCGEEIAQGVDTLRSPWELNTMPGRSYSLPLVESTAGKDWHGWMPAAAPPEPEEPQGEYRPANELESPSIIPSIESDRLRKPVELLAPAGGPDAAFAAFHYGADAIYLGLKKFSARAEAENFTLEELSEVTSYAHSLKPRRRVFVTINTLIRQDELAEVIEALCALTEIGVDALIIQDLGVYHLVRQHFPDLELHASTQLAVHNGAGARVLQGLGFTRVVLARELTFEEVRDITTTSGIETEVFIHGALCYSYSGLCMFSSQTLGRSGNRGKCAYSCRDAYEVKGAPDTLRDGSGVKRDPAVGFPFSMKDLALPDFLPSLRGAGVSCFKIEGRKKSPLYVATTTDYYRKLLDGRLAAGERAVQEADLQAVFSRPWTRLFLQSHKDKEVADRDTVGHRGTPIGNVEAVRKLGAKEARLRFRTQRPLERHDGLQVDLPTLGKPFGFPVDRLWICPVGKKPAREVIEAPAGSRVEVELPLEYPPLPAGSVVYCSSSQAVKRSYRHDRPKPGLFRVRHRLQIEVALHPDEIVATGQICEQHFGMPVIEVRRRLAGKVEPAKDPANMEGVAKTAFSKLWDTGLELESFTLQNDYGLFVPVSRLNQLRRELTAGLDEALAQAARRHVEVLQAKWQVPSETVPESKAFRWSIKVDRIGFVADFDETDWLGVDELVVDVARDHPALLSDHLEQLASVLGRERIRLAVPALTRKWEEHGIQAKIDKLRAGGWNRWEAANLAAWNQLGLDPLATSTGAIDLSTDWSVYVLNRAAARQLLAMGVSRFALSPEDGLANWQSLLAEFGPRAVVIVYQDTPLFIAESCAYANLIGGCPGKANCRFESMEMVSSHGEKVTALDYHCRTIVLNQGPFCLARRLQDLAKAGAISLRADFVYRSYEAAEVRRRWRAVRAGKTIGGEHAANFDRGML
jgi:putative protease